MNINDYKNVLEEMIHTTLYVRPTLTSEQEKYYSDIKEYLKNSNDQIADIRTLVSTRTNENYYAYDTYLEDFLTLISLENKLELLNNQSKYEDIFKNDSVYIALWDSLDVDTQIQYLVDKRKFSKVDYALMNHSVEESSYFHENVLLNELLNNLEIRKKIDPFTIELHYSYHLLSLINFLEKALFINP